MIATTLLARLGVDEPVRQAIVGHASIQVHGLYRHVDMVDKRVALERLGGLLDVPLLTGQK